MVAKVDAQDNNGWTHLKQGADNNEIVLLYNNLNAKQKENLEKCAQLLKAGIVDKFTFGVTHIIIPCDKKRNCISTIEVLMGIISGKWIMNYNWIEVCLENKQKVDEKAFEVKGTVQQPTSRGPQLGRKNIKQKIPPLFDGIYFYLYGSFYKPIPDREDLRDLIILGGGTVLVNEPREEVVAAKIYKLAFHAAGTPAEDVTHFILYQDKPRRNRYFCHGPIRTIHVTWLIDSVSEFKLKDFSNYTQSSK